MNWSVYSIDHFTWSRISRQNMAASEEGSEWYQGTEFTHKFFKKLTMGL